MLQFLGLKHFLYIGGVALIGFLLTFSYLKGKWACEQAHELEMASLTLEWAEQLDARDEENRELERMVLEKEIVVEEKIVEIIKEIPKYITVDKCRVNDAGVQHIRGRVSELFPTAK